MNAATLQNLVDRGQRMLGRLDYRGALQVFSEADVRFPSQAMVKIGLAAAHLGTGNPERGVALYRETLKLKPGWPAALCGLGQALALSGRFEEAMNAYREARAKAPNTVMAVTGEVEALRMLGRTEEALRLADEVVRSGRVDGLLASNYCELCGKAGRHAEGVVVAERVLGGAIPPPHRIQLLFSLGQLLEKMGDFDGAFARFKEANGLYPPGAFSIEAYRGGIDAIMAAFAADRMGTLARAKRRDEAPVFIVGMPRSGTSLVEQILSCHPRVYGAGELPDLHDLAGRLALVIGDNHPYPRCVAGLTEASAERAADIYLRRIHALAPGAARITDKMPHNFLHVGLICLLFPGARVVHCVRDAMDTCVSCFTTIMNPTHAYSADQATLGHAYRQYRRLMDHWKAVATVPMMDVVYEELTADPGPVVRRLVEFVGLEWNERCLRHHESTRVTRTPSVDQVRQPIYQGSVGRWRRYEKHVGELRAALGEFARAGPG